MKQSAKITLRQYALNGRGERICSTESEHASLEAAMSAEKNKNYPEFQIIESAKTDDFMDMFSDDSMPDVVLFDSTQT